jgi:two-component system sensor histidine kinase YesM
MNRTKTSLFLRYLAIVLIPMFVLLVMGAISIVINQRYAVSQIQRGNLMTLERIKNSVDMTFEELDSLQLIFSTSSEFLVSLDRIMASEALTFEQTKILAAIQDFVNVSAYARPYVESIYVYIENRGRRVLTTTRGIVPLDSFYDTAWYDSFVAHTQSEGFWTETRLLRHFPAVEQGRPVISVFRRVYPLTGVHVPGVVVLNIYADYLEVFLQQLKNSPEQGIVILDDAHRVVFSDFAGYEPGMLAGAAREEGQRMVPVQGTAQVMSWLVSPKYGWTYLSFIPQQRLYGVSDLLRAINIAVVCLSALVGIVITFFVSRWSFRHIEGVLDIAEAADRGGPLPPLQMKADRGFNHITYSILRTFLEYKYLKVQLSERQYKQKTLELLALQSQMNPHFLFNTLETINWKIIKMTKRPNQINRMIQALSRILGYALQSPFQLEPLASEMRHARDYLGIQRIRYKNRFTVVWQCAPGLEQRKVIRFLLQPLLENAIYHGIREAEGRGTITITVDENDGQLRLVVRDDGLGIEPERLREIEERLQGEEAYSEASASGIGLYNVNKRVKLAFGPEYGLRIQSAHGWGTSVTVQIPSRS